MKATAYNFIEDFIYDCYKETHDCENCPYVYEEGTEIDDCVSLRLHSILKDLDIYSYEKEG